MTESRCIGLQRCKVQEVRYVLFAGGARCIACDPASDMTLDLNDLPVAAHRVKQ